MTDAFVFKQNPSVQTVLNALSSPHGAEAVSRVVDEFSSLRDALHHVSKVGDSTVVHMPDGNNIAFVHAAPRTVAQAAYEIAVVNHFQIA